jgi:hypothetical protein
MADDAQDIDFDALISKQVEVVQREQERVVEAGSPSGDFLQAASESIQTSVNVLLQLREASPDQTPQSPEEIVEDLKRLGVDVSIGHSES